MYELTMSIQDALIFFQKNMKRSVNESYKEHGVTILNAVLQSITLREILIFKTDGMYAFVHKGSEMSFNTLLEFYSFIPNLNELITFAATEPIELEEYILI